MMSGHDAIKAASKTNHSVTASNSQLTDTGLDKDSAYNNQMTFDPVLQPRSVTM